MYDTRHTTQVSINHTGSVESTAAHVAAPDHAAPESDSTTPPTGSVVRNETDRTGARSIPLPPGRGTMAPPQHTEPSLTERRFLRRASSAHRLHACSDMRSHARTQHKGSKKSISDNRSSIANGKDAIHDEHASAACDLTLIIPEQIKCEPYFLYSDFTTGVFCVITLVFLGIASGLRVGFHFPKVVHTTQQKP